MPSNEIANRGNETSLRSAALVAGIGLAILVVTVVSAEFLVKPRLFVPGNAGETAHSIQGHRGLFLTMVFGYLISFICDLVVAWALYVFLKPANKTVALLAAWCRLVYMMIALVALLNLLTALHLLSGADYLNVFETDQLHAQVLASINKFNYEWDLGFPFFGIHLGLLGYLILRSNYVPSILGILLILGGAGYLVEYGLKPLLFPGLNTDLLMATFFGELLLMVWLLIRGGKHKQSVGRA